jgi:citrate synthase
VLTLDSDGRRGTIHFREHNLDKLVRNNDWEEVVFMINWGYLPTSDEKMQFRRSLAEAMMAPQAVVDVIRAFP